MRAFGIENEADIKHIENVIAESRTQAKVSRHLALMVIEGFGEDPAEYGFTKEKPALAQYSTTLLLKEIFRRINA